MVIIGGVGSILGSFFGAAFIMCCRLSSIPRPSRSQQSGCGCPAAVSNLELVIFGALIIFFLIVEPLGLARMWQIAKEKMRYGRSRTTAGGFQSAERAYDWENAFKKLSSSTGTSCSVAGIIEEEDDHDGESQAARPLGVALRQRRHAGAGAGEASSSCR